MKLSQEVHKFGSASEELMATATISGRSLTEDEARLVSYYCKEVLQKMVPENLRNGQ